VDGARGRETSSSGRKQPAKRSRRPVSAPKIHARIIAVANQKGGVGKSTTAVSLGAALAELGKRVLVVDLDPQGNASTGLGIRHEAREVTVYDVLAAEAPIEGAIVPTPVENLFAIPSTIDLAGAEIELVSQFSRELRLRRALDPLRDDEFDFILLDCPPSLGLLTVNALAAAEELIVPIQCEYYALEGLGQLLRNVRLVQQNVNQQLRLTGIVMTMFDPRTKLSEQVVDEVRRYFGDRVYETIIPRTVRLSEAPGFGQPITVYDPKSRGAQRYRALAQEVVAKLPDEGPLPVIDDLPRVVLPPREPEPGRAPRPLVSDDDDLEEMVEAPSEEPGLELGAESGPQVEATPEVEVNDTPSTISPGRPETANTSEEAEVEVSAAAGEHGQDEAGPGEAEPVVESEAEPGSVEPVSAAEAGVEPGDGPEPGLEDTEVVVIEEETQAPSSEVSEAPDPDTRDAPRKRWSLFRRGGDR
jgi:chromosome partitioning protein